MSLELDAVEIALGEDVYTLTPTLRAMTTINQRFGSFTAASRAVIEANFEAVVAIIRLGAGLSEKEARALPEAVFAQGLVTLLEPVSKYLTLLSLGGRWSAGDDIADVEGNDSQRKSGGPTSTAKAPAGSAGRRAKSSTAT